MSDGDEMMCPVQHLLDLKIPARHPAEAEIEPRNRSEVNTKPYSAERCQGVME
jgi:hypothetical protein